MLIELALLSVLVKVMSPPLASTVPAGDVEIEPSPMTEIEPVEALLNHITTVSAVPTC